MLDLRLLKTFVVVGRVLHFGRAAEILHATQPGVSQHVQRLEAQLGFDLLKRSRRSVALTDAGAMLMRQASRLLLLAERMEHDARAVATGRGGQLAVGLSSSIVYGDLPAKISAFRRANPGLTVHLAVHSGDVLQERLDAYTLDAVITTLPFQGDDYRSIVLDIPTRMGVALPADHPLAGSRTLSIRRLAKEEFIVVPREQHPEAHDSLTAVLRVSGGAARISGHEVSFPNLIARVAMGEGLAMVPIAYRDMAPVLVRVVPVRDRELAQLKTHLITRNDCDHAAMPGFIDALSARTRPRK